jgi:hypothetical protein
VTASQARRLADYAAGDHGAQWRIIVTTASGTALAVTRARARAPGPGPFSATSRRGPGQMPPRPAGR